MILDFNKIYYTYKNKPYKIIQRLSKTHARIQFLETGNFKDVWIRHIKDGHISDELFDKNKIYISNKGQEYKILGPTKNRVHYVDVLFLKTNHIQSFRLDHAITGAIWDNSIPKVHGVGTYGNVSNHYAVAHWYAVWSGMIRRCYDPKSKEYGSYGGKGIRVCDRWLTFEYFIDDLPNLINFEKVIYDPYNYHLDKDLLQIGVPDDQKIYSPDTCLFLSIKDNFKLRASYNNPQTAQEILNKILLEDISN